MDLNDLNSNMLNWRIYTTFHWGLLGRRTRSSRSSKKAPHFFSINEPAKYYCASVRPKMQQTPCKLFHKSSRGTGWDRTGLSRVFSTKANAGEERQTAAERQRTD